MIDTNILLDWLLDHDSIRTEQIDKLFTTIKELYIPDVILVELEPLCLRNSINYRET